MEYDEFRDTVKKVGSNRKHKISGSIGIYDIYKIIRKGGWNGIGLPISEKLFYKIIGSINKKLAQHFINTGELILPLRLGSLELRKTIPVFKIVDNKIVSSLPIDWDGTIRLWYEDEDSKRLKLLLRKETDSVFRTIYNKRRANYNNKAFYLCRVTRSIKQQLSRLAKENNLDAYLLYRND